SGGHLDRRRAAGAARLGAAGAPGATPGRGLRSTGGRVSLLEVDVRDRLGDFALEAQFAAPARGVTALFGPSGAGKTSLVNILAGLVRPAAGRVVLAGEVLTDAARGIHLPPERRRLGYVFQE